VRSLLERHGADVSFWNDLTPLHRLTLYDHQHASHSVSLDIAELLFLHDSDVNAQDLGGISALQIATEYKGNPHIVRISISHGADVNVRNIKGQPPLNHDLFAPQDKNNLDVPRIFVG
jgi:ankyrin repeat protein